MVAAHLDSLLHTLRSMDRHEEELCSLLHEIRRAGKVSTPVRNHLRRLLDDMPSRQYQTDLDSICQALEA